jgi:hypothetical protein
MLCVDIVYKVNTSMKKFIIKDFKTLFLPTKQYTSDTK